MINTSLFFSFSGRGWIAGAATVVCLLASDYLTGLYYHDSNYYAHNGWPKLAAFWAAGVIVQFLLPGREEVLDGTGEVVEQRSILKHRDKLFYIPVRFWPMISFVLGIIFYFVRD
ncbi:hypothetical protein [Terracidiphilus gabretensis]|jgi:hypothetical protein|uniref:hypothetical protein n=1 Tax=Terracidiphilus gabretensis TaxID=1577687 RepID=UPI00071B722F|nr:hypothetical protein [Terracidiphilus gabretensis]